VTGNRVRLSWAPAAGVGVGGAVYDVLVNDRLIGRTYRTAVTVTGLVPDTEYRFRVAVRDRDGREQPYTRSVTVRTAPLQQGALPATVMLHNSLTGMAVDAVGGSFRDGVPLIQYAVNGYLNQRWTLTPGAGGTVTLRSAVSGKCVQPYRGRLAAGTAVVQQACDGSAGQRWRLVRTRHGYALSTADGRLVLGVGSLRYAGERLLALQPPTGARYQSWNLTER